MFRHGGAISSNKETAEIFVEKFKDFVVGQEFIPKQVFNCDETGLFWKKGQKGFQGETTVSVPLRKPQEF